jgi:hypothetical protein
VGLGITTDFEGGILYTQVFSYFAPSGSEVSNTRDALEGLVLNLNSHIQIDPTLSGVAASWNSFMGMIPFFAYEHQGDSLIRRVRAIGDQASVRTFLFQHSLLSGLKDQMMANNITMHLKDRRWQRIGLDVEVDAKGLSLLTVILAD